MMFSRTFMVREATKKMGHHLDVTLNRTDLAYRLSVMVGEMREMMIAAQSLSDALYQKRGEKDIRVRAAAFLHEMADVAYTLDGTAATFGWDMDKAFEAVHAANMTKEAPGDPFTKWKKGEGFKPADMTEALGAPSDTKAA